MTIEERSVPLSSKGMRAYLSRPGIDHPYKPDVYTPEMLGEWRATADRQAAKDRIIVPKLLALLPRGRLLELGAGCGQLSLIAREQGFNVVASDYAAFFVDHLAKLGLDAHRVDATDIASAQLGLFDGIVSQGATPFTTTDWSVVEQAVASVHGALRPGGSFLLIHGVRLDAGCYDRDTLAARFRGMARDIGFSATDTFWNQVLPSKAYRLLPGASTLEHRLGQRLGRRLIVLAHR